MANEFETRGRNRVGLLVAALTEYLTASGLDEARTKSEQLVAHYLGCSRLELNLRQREEVAPDILSNIARQAARLACGEPLQYVLGTVVFMGHKLAADYRALIPRPETEELVDLVLHCEDLRRCACPLIVDVGTGSGCIAIALALAWPNARVVASDISAEALALARENVRLHALTDRIVWIRCDLLDGMGCEAADAIVANLPYVRSAEWSQLPREIREHEPRDALDGGKDGLVLISRLVPDARRVLKCEGWLFLEVGEEQGPSVCELMRQAGFGEIEVRNDMSGKPRFVRGRKP